jgi:phage terminase large subunit
MLTRNPEYVTNLLVLPERMRRALLEGDWDAFAGQFFPFQSDRQLIKPFIIENEWPLIGALDPGWGGFCSYSLAAVDFSNHYYRLATYYDEQKNIIKNVKAIYKFTKSLNLTRGRMPEYVVADPAAWAKRDQFAITEDNRTFADFMEQAGFSLFKGLNDRQTGWANMVTMMEQKDERNGDPMYMVFKNYNEPFIEQVVAAIGDDKKPGDLAGQGRDPKLAYHCLDEERYRLMAIAFPEALDKPKTELERIVDDEIEASIDKHTVMGV